MLEEAYRFCEGTRNRTFLVVGARRLAARPGPSWSRRVARSLGLTVPELREEYRRVTRRARRVVERRFYDQALSRVCAMMSRRRARGAGPKGDDVPLHPQVKTLLDGLAAGRRPAARRAVARRGARGVQGPDRLRPARGGRPRRRPRSCPVDGTTSRSGCTRPPTPSAATRRCSSGSTAAAG